MKFPDYSKHTCVNNVYYDLVTKFLPAENSVSPIRTLKLKSNTIPWLDVDFLNVIRNSD